MDIKVIHAARIDDNRKRIARYAADVRKRGSLSELACIAREDDRCEKIGLGRPYNTRPEESSIHPLVTLNEHLMNYSICAAKRELMNRS